MEQSYQFEDVVTVFDIVLRVTVIVVGALWALYKVKEYREFKRLVQLDIDTHPYKLNRPIASSSKLWNGGLRVKKAKINFATMKQVLVADKNGGNA